MHPFKYYIGGLKTNERSADSMLLAVNKTTQKQQTQTASSGQLFPPRRRKERRWRDVIGRFYSPAGCGWCASHPSRRCTACPGGTGRWPWPPPGWRGLPPSAPGGGRCRAPGSGWAGQPQCALAGSPTPDWKVEENWVVELKSCKKVTVDSAATWKPITATLCGNVRWLSPSGKTTITY